MAEDFEKIKRNVLKMLALQAPEQDIDEYLKSERLSADDFKSVAQGKLKLGDVRMNQKTKAEIAKTYSAGQTLPVEGIGRGSILPFSKAEETGEVFFDPDAGLLGGLKRFAMLPGDVAMGKLNPETDEGARRMAEFAMVGAPTAVASRVGETAIPGTLKALRLGKTKVPTAQELKAAGSAGFDNARGLGVDYSPVAVKSMLDDITRSLEESGLNDVTVPKTLSLLSRAKDAPTAGAGETVVTSLDNLISLRKSLQEAAGSGDAPERKAATRAINELDGFISRADAPGVVAGPASAAGDVLSTARANYSAGMRSDSIARALDKAGRDAQKSGSGSNLDNAIRQRLDRVLDKDARGFSPEEVKALESAIRGSKGTNTARSIGKLGHGGLMTTAGAGLGATLGNLIGGPVGGAIGAAAVPAAGITARNIAEQMTRSAAKRLDELLRKRSPLYEQRKAGTPAVQGLNTDIRALIQRLLIEAGATQPQQ
jgi:hypothetical protein